MDQQDFFKDTIKAVHRILMTAFAFVGIVAVLLIFVMIDPDMSSLKSNPGSEYVVVEEVDEDRIVDGIHEASGLIDAEGLMTVVNNCTNCHSARIIIQNRMNEERWAATIDWMQETQNLWDLGGNEEIIIQYLVKNYPPKKVGRRAALTNIDWYELK